MDMRYTSGVAVVPAVIDETPIASTDEDLSAMNIDSLTAEIKMYLHIVNQSIIEVGKRLILAKKLVPHGEWLNWLKNNFNLKYTVATRFMQIAERFSNVPTSEHLKTSQMFELLSLPAGDEQKFIAEKAAEGNPVDQMTIKKLRAEVKKWKDEFASSEKSNQGLESYISILRNEMAYYRTELDTTKITHVLFLNSWLSKKPSKFLRPIMKT